MELKEIVSPRKESVESLLDCNSDPTQFLALGHHSITLNKTKKMIFYEIVEITLEKQIKDLRVCRSRFSRGPQCSPN